MFRIFGPPGTGKTTTLLNMVDDALEAGVHPHRIAFLAFTRKAANEAKERAAARFGLDPKKDLIYFRTLHSLALTSTDIRPEQVMQAAHYKELGDAIGVSLVGAKHDQFEDISTTTAANDPVLGLINLARMRQVSLRDQYNHSNIGPDWNTVNYVDKCLREYKEKMGLYDFTDMLTEFVRQSDKYCPEFELCFLDEAQDLSNLQWDIAFCNSFLFLTESFTKVFLSFNSDICLVLMTLLLYCFKAFSIEFLLSTLTIIIYYIYLEFFLFLTIGTNIPIFLKNKLKKYGS